MYLIFLERFFKTSKNNVGVINITDAAIKVGYKAEEILKTLKTFSIITIKISPVIALQIPEIRRSESFSKSRIRLFAKFIIYITSKKSKKTVLLIFFTFYLPKLPISSQRLHVSAKYHYTHLSISHNRLSKST